VRKAALQESLAGLTRQIIEEQKKAAAANKEKAVAAAVEAADAAAAGGQKFLVARLEVGLDTKAIQVRHCGAASAAAAAAAAAIEGRVLGNRAAPSPAMSCCS
jgi:alanyl-tRNA synthetase